MMPSVTTDNALTLSTFQARAMATPEECDLVLLGGKGSGKTHLLSILPLRQAEQLGSKCRALFLRLSHGGGREFELKTQELYATIYGAGGVRFNAQTGLFRFHNGATLEVDQLAEPADYQKHMGKNFTLIMVDEVGEYGDMTLIDKVRASLRPPLGVQARMVLCGNPGGPNHANLLKRFVAGTTPWVPRIDQQTGKDFIWCPSTYRDNPHIDQDEYAAQLRAACMNDPALLAAWLDGSFAVSKGGFFASVIDENRNMIEAWPAIPKHHGESWQTYLAHDFGSSAPSVTFLVARSPGAEAFGTWFPRDSLVLADELATNEPGSLTRGLGWTVPILAEAIREMCARWKVKAQGVADDAIFSRMGSAAGSISDEFRLAGVSFYPARKADRVSGWQTMRRLLADAGQPDLPGLYIARHCSYFWATVPYLSRDPKRPEDVDSRGADHAGDAARYSCLHERRVVRQHDMSEAWSRQRAVSAGR